MPLAADLMLSDLKQRYAARAATDAFTRLYDDREFGHMFSVLHQCLNQHFIDINGRAKRLFGNLAVRRVGSVTWGNSW
jgi:hypothetical protein